MRTQVVIAALIMMVGCKGALKTAATAFENEAEAGPTSCSPGMTLVPAQVGSASFCIDTASAGQLGHSAAIMGCADRGANLCSFQELQVACLGGQALANEAWTGAISSTGSSTTALTVKTDCTRGGPWTINATTLRAAYCCSR